MTESFSNRQQRTKIDNAFSHCSTLFFNIYHCEIFFYTTECYIYYIASYVDNNTSYNFDFSLDIAVSNLGKSTNSLNWPEWVTWLTKLAEK